MLSSSALSFHRPEARLVDATNGAVLMNQSHPDLLSVQVTLVHHGVGSVKLSLNNQRFAQQAERPVPAQPPWKYNDLATWKFGQRIRVDMRYLGGPWTPMIFARVTDIKFDFGGSGARLEVNAEDMLSLLKAKPRDSKRYPERGGDRSNNHELTIVQDVLERAGAVRAVDGVSIEIDPALQQTPLRSMTHQPQETYMQFVEQLLENLDHELFSEFEQLELPEPSDGAPSNVRPKIHFVPARSLTLGTTINLRWATPAENARTVDQMPLLMSFSPQLELWKQFDEARCRGADPRTAEIIEDTVDAQVVRDDLHAAPGGPTPMTAIELREQFYVAQEGVSVGNRENINLRNVDAARARLRAAKLLRNRAREFLRASGETIGLPKLRPGVHINLGGFHAPFDGIYYVTQTVHTIDARGYRTRFNVRRPGMLNPADYPNGSQA